MDRDVVAGAVVPVAVIICAQVLRMTLRRDTSTVSDLMLALVVFDILVIFQPAKFRAILGADVGLFFDYANPLFPILGVCLYAAAVVLSEGDRDAIDDTSLVQKSIAVGIASMWLTLHMLIYYPGG